MRNCALNGGILPIENNVLEQRIVAFQLPLSSQHTSKIVPAPVNDQRACCFVYPLPVFIQTPLLRFPAGPY